MLDTEELLRFLPSLTCKSGPSSCHRFLDPLTDPSGLKLGDCRHDCEDKSSHNRISRQVREVEERNLHSGIHQPQNQADIPGQSVEFGNSQSSAQFLASCQGGLQLGAIATPSRFDLGKRFGNGYADPFCILFKRNFLSFEAQTGAPLALGGDAVVGDKHGNSPDSNEQEKLSDEIEGCLRRLAWRQKWAAPFGIGNACSLYQPSFFD